MGVQGAYAVFEFAVGVLHDVEQADELWEVRIYGSEVYGEGTYDLAVSPAGFGVLVGHCCVLDVWVVLNELVDEVEEV